MDDPRWAPGMPVLDRQPVPATSAAAAPPRNVPETAPTPLQRHYISLSVVALVAGTIAITALETGSSPRSVLVKACVAVGAPILVLTTADAALRIWRSVQAWLPVDRGRALFRLAWLAAAAIGLIAVATAAALVIVA